MQVLIVVPPCHVLKDGSLQLPPSALDVQPMQYIDSKPHRGLKPLWHLSHVIVGRCSTMSALLTAEAVYGLGQQQCNACPCRTPVSLRSGGLQSCWLHPVCSQSDTLPLQQVMVGLIWMLFCITIFRVPDEHTASCSNTPE